ncbi:MAG: hypothetical protein COA60_004205 [Robiginitomaculum sp.]|nr:hypothetical protein [Robiginitomaculum sp.]
MKTINLKTALIAIFAISTLGVAVPALADDRSSRNVKPPPVSSSYYDRGGYRDNYRVDRDQRRWKRDRKNRNRYSDRRDNRRYDNRRWRNDPHKGRYRSERRYPRSWYNIRGKIISTGRGRNDGCFRVKRSGKYNHSPAIVTVRYCENRYGKPVKVHSSKRLVRYTRPAYYR